MVLVDVEHRIQDSLDKLVDEFFSSVDGDDSKITTFLSSWSMLDATIRQHSDELQQSTLNGVCSIAATVSAMASSILDLQDTSNRIRDELDTDIVKILNDDLDHLTISGGQEFHRIAETSVLPAYIKACYSWLLTNLHNPYPSIQTKNLISQQTNTSMKNIDSWFTDARRRIGWNTIRKTRFSSRAEMTVAASTFFNCDDPLPGKIPRSDCHIDFVGMRHRALTLYEHHTVISGESSTSTSSMQNKRKRSPAASPSCAYPSPASSRSGSPQIPSQNPPSTHPVRVRKRSITPASFADDTCKPSKRQRVEVSTEITDHFPHLPSPASSICLLDSSDVSPPLTTVDIPSHTTGKRKRDSLDDNGPISKRLHHSSVVANSSAVLSGTMGGPTLNSMPELYDLTSNLPPGVTVPDIDGTTPVDLTLEQFSFSSFAPKELVFTDCSAPPPASLEICNGIPFFDSVDSLSSDQFFADFAERLDTLGLDLKTPDCAIQSGEFSFLSPNSPECAILPPQYGLAGLFDADQIFFQSFHPVLDLSHPHCNNTKAVTLAPTRLFAC